MSIQFGLRTRCDKNGSLLKSTSRGLKRSFLDEKIQEIKHNNKEEKSPGFSKDEEGIIWYMGRICVHNIRELKDKILREAHESAYSIHPGVTENQKSRI
jgi:hypothetical protein